MTSYILEVQEDDSGELFIALPDDIIDHLGWQEGDLLNWDIKSEGIILSKVNDPSSYEVVED
jgi:bifunctional DNA-binding transcriptional regulator/antitoxin component of YhaV-PrlF toxin-antitoxin module